MFLGFLQQYVTAFYPLNVNTVCNNFSYSSSYFAVVSGSYNVFACDYSQTMIGTAKAIAETNGCKDYVTFIGKLSNDLVIPEDVPRKYVFIIKFI